MACEEPVKVPDGYDAIFFITGYNEKGIFIMTEADKDWSYDVRVHFNKVPERFVLLKKREDKTIFKPYTSLFIGDGKIFNTKEEAEGVKVKRSFFA